VLVAAWGSEFDWYRHGYDQALCEGFFATPEYELFDGMIFQSQAEAQVAVFDFIEGFYNLHSRHSSTSDLSPGDYYKEVLLNPS
jgi:putative transposase